MNTTVDSRRKFLFTSLSLGAAAAVPSFGALAQSATIRVGLLPNVSSRILFTQYQTLRQHLEAELSIAVELLTATDFKTFHSRTRAGEYDMVITAANMARLAQVDSQWVPIAIYEPSIPSLLVRSKSAKSGGIAGLKGKKLAMANPQSLVALRGFTWLAEQGLKRDVDYTIQPARTDDSLGVLLNSPDTPFAMMSMGEFRSIPEATRALLEIETEFAKIPAFTVLHAPGMVSERAAKLKAAMLSFGASAFGKSFFEQTGFRGVRALQAGELEALDPYILPTRAALSG